MDAQGHAACARANYDYPASRLEGIVASTAWTGCRVMGMSDCLWGLLDGINDAGLAVSLTFGGRRATGRGFGVPPSPSAICSRRARPRPRRAA